MITSVNKQTNKQIISSKSDIGGRRSAGGVGLTVYPEHRLKLVLLEQDLVHRLLDGREVEVGLGDDDAGVRKVHLEEEVDLDREADF